MQARKEEPEETTILMPPGDPATEDVPPATPTHADRFYSAFRTLLFSSYPAMDTAYMSRSFWQSGMTSIPMVASGTMLAFLTSFGLNVPVSQDNYQALVDYFRYHKLPDDWPQLDRNEEIKALILSFLPGLIAPFLIGVQAFYFINAIPTEDNLEVNAEAWKIFSGLMAACAACTTLFTHSAETWKSVRIWTAGQYPPYQNAWGYYVAPWAGAELGVLDSLQNIAQEYITLKSTFQITSFVGRLFVGLPSLLTSFTNFCFVSMFGTHAFESFFDYLFASIKNKSVDPKTVTVFSVSAILACYLAWLKRPLNESFYQDAATDFGLPSNEITEEIALVLSWIIMIGESILLTASLNELRDYFTCSPCTRQTIIQNDPMQTFPAQAEEVESPENEDLVAAPAEDSVEDSPIATFRFTDYAMSFFHRSAHDDTNSTTINIAPTDGTQTPRAWCNIL